MKLLFLLLLLGIASVFSVDSVFAEELIPLDVEVNKQNFQFGDVVFLKITPEKIIPNTPFTMHLIDKHGNIQYHENLVLKENSKEFVYTLPNGYLSTVNTDEEYELHIYYGSKNNHVGYEIENISINSEPNKISKFIIENYFPDKFDIGTEIQIRDIRSYTFSDDLICDSIPCHEITLSRVYSESYVNFGSPSSNTNLIFYHFKNIENLTKYFNDFPEDFESYEMNGFTCHSIKAEPWEIKCHNEEILFHIISSSVSKNLNYVAVKRDFVNILTEKITSNPIDVTLSAISEPSRIYNYSPTHIENYPDSTKSPQYYLDRYDNEPEYKEWFDSQFPDTILSEILAQKEPEPPKIPDWVKNTMQWYLDGSISEDEMISAIEYLVKEGIIQV